MNTEEGIERLRVEGDLRGAATRAIAAYGPGVFGFLVTVLRNEGEAGEVYSQSCEDMWRGLPGFKGQCTMRSWFYVLARHAMVRFKRSPFQRLARRAGLSEISELAERVLTETRRYLRTSAKDKLASIRDALSEDDRALLVLRVDRGMTWADIARAFSSEDAPMEEARRRASALRKRYQRLKDEIRKSVEKAGLLDGARG